jgi:hypothetical protein
MTESPRSPALGAFGQMKGIRDFRSMYRSGLSTSECILAIITTIGGDFMARTTPAYFDILQDYGAIWADSRMHGYKRMQHTHLYATYNS